MEEKVLHDTTPQIWLRKKINCLQALRNRSEITQADYDTEVAQARLDCQLLEQINQDTNLTIKTPVGPEKVVFNDFKTTTDAIIHIGYRLTAKGGLFYEPFDREQTTIIKPVS